MGGRSSPLPDFCASLPYFPLCQFLSFGSGKRPLWGQSAVTILSSDDAIRSGKVDVIHTHVWARCLCQAAGLGPKLQARWRLPWAISIGSRLLAVVRLINSSVAIQVKSVDFEMSAKGLMLDGYLDTLAGIIIHEESKKSDRWALNCPAQCPRPPVLSYGTS